MYECAYCPTIAFSPRDISVHVLMCRSRLQVLGSYDKRWPQQNPFRFTQLVWERRR